VGPGAARGIVGFSPPLPSCEPVKAARKGGLKPAIPGFAFAALFLIANRAAYNGFLQHDDFAHLSWTGGQLVEYLRDLASPLFYPHQYRPLGHLWYAIMGRTARLDYGWYVAWMHLLHLAAAWLVWRLLRRLELPPFAAASGTLFFLFHRALFDIYWHSAYVFDLMCTVLSLGALLAYIGRRWLLSFLCCWLAYKAKEPAIMLPLVLAAYEYLFGERNWKRLIPYLGIGLLFGLQAVLRTPSRGNDYEVRFSLPLLGYYTGQLAVAPWAVLALPLLLRDRRAWWGLAAFLLLLTPMLFLPGRARPVYLCESMIGAAALFGATAARVHPGVVILFFAAWFPWTYGQLRPYRSAALDEARENRAYAEGLLRDARAFPHTRRFLFESVPAGLPDWAVEGAIRYLYGRHDPEVRWIGSFASREEAWDWPRAALLSWDPLARRLEVLRRGPPVSYIRMDGSTPAWQLLEGWHGPGPGVRWMAASARAVLYRPPGPARFEIKLAAGGPVETSFEPPEGSGPVTVWLRVTRPGLPRGNEGPLGAAITAFGFAP